MDVHRKRLIGGTAAAVALSALVATGASAGDRSAHPARSLDSYGATVRFDSSWDPVVRARPGEHALLGARGAVRSSRTLRRDATLLARGSAAGECIKNRSRRGLVDKGVIHREYTNNKAYYIRFLYFYYRQNKARRVGRRHRLTRQIEICTVGGAHAKGGNRLDRVMSYMVFTSKKDRLINWKWGKGHEQDTAKRSLTFSVSVKPVTIGASIPVEDSGYLRGAQGYDKDTPRGLKPYVFNQVVALWEDGGVRGSTGFQGNVAHALWEIPQSMSPSKVPSFGLEAGVEYQCGRVIVSCEKP